MDQLLQGMICASITPFTKENEVDIKSLRAVCRYLVEHKINGMFPSGTNGEGILLSVEERKKITEVVIHEISGQIPVVIQCGASNTENTVELAKHAASAGADGVGIMAPYFFAQDEQAIFDYYMAVARSVPDKPAYIYNIPIYTNNDLLPELVERIRKGAPNIVGIKYSFPNLLRLGEYLKLDPSFSALIGCDRLVLPALALGASGTVSGPVAVFPQLFTGLWEAYRKNDIPAAREYQLKIFDTDKALTAFPGIPLLKTYLKEIGVIATDLCRTPFRSLTAQEARSLMQIVEKYQ